ncbi:conserved hypothetical protein [uncultured Desulfobacterium sp.]|uniref:Uncharacterized protein n=1 Tax=uncultured Desulfobacterium sp. TaxID=201089 RepID=A0A445N2L1_9BACT|nr:conserved hypothetical protein [uncultured Desulfobacterium sp.]
MKTLHILKTEADDTTMALIEGLERDGDATLLKIDDFTNYEELIDQIFEHDLVVTWW